MSTPRGWNALAELDPLVDRLDARCEICDSPALVKVLESWRCAQHPPVPGEWGAGLNWAPRLPSSYCAPRRCYCGRCPDPAPPSSPRSQPDELLARRASRLAPTDGALLAAMSSARR